MIAQSTNTFYDQSMTAYDIYRIAGGGSGLGQSGNSGNGGSAVGADLDAPQSVTIDGSGNVVIADTGNNEVRVVAESTATFYGVSMTEYEIYPVAGDGTAGYSGDGGSATSAELSDPTSVVVNAAGQLTIADTYNGRLRQVSGGPMGLASAPPVVPEGAPVAAGSTDNDLAACGCANAGVPESGSTGDPIDTESGAYTETSTDLTVPGAGIPLTFTRTYRSDLAQLQADSDGPPISPLGVGSFDNYGWSVSVSSGVATVTDAGGAQTMFTSVSDDSPSWCADEPSGPSGSTTYCADAPRTEAVLYELSSGGWQLDDDVNGTDTDYTFTSAGVLTEVSDANGDTLSAGTYSPSGSEPSCASGDTCIAWTSSASGRELVLETNGSGELVSVFDPVSGEAATYTYSGSGCSSWSSGEPVALCSVTLPGSITTKFTYDSSNSTAAYDYDLLTSTSPAGETTNTYGSAGRVIEQVDPNGQVVELAYSATGATYLTSAGGATTVTTYPTGLSGSSNVRVDSYSSGVLNGQTTGSGTSAVSKYFFRDPVSLDVLSTLDGNGGASSSSFQNYGTSGGSAVSAANVTSSADAMGNITLTAYTPIPTSSGEPPANLVYCTVEPAEELDGVTCPSSPPTTPPSAGSGASSSHLGTEITYFNAAGQSVAQTNADGYTSVTAYTSGVSGVPNGLPYCTVDAENYSVGDVTCPAYGASHVSGTQTKTFDSYGDVLTSTDADGDTTTNCYFYENSTGQCAAGAPSGSNPELLYSSTDPDGTTTVYTYNAAGQVTKSVASFGSYSATTITGYDSSGRAFCTIAPLAYSQGHTTCPSTPPTSPPTAGTDPWPGATITIFDDDSRPVYSVNPLGGVTETAYDAAGETFCSVAPAGYAADKTCPSSPPSSPPTPSSDSYLGMTITTFNSLGQVTQVTSPIGGITTKSYDADGDLVETQVESSNSTSAPTVTTTYTYDADDRQTSETVGSGGSAQTTEQFYDPDGNVYCSVSANAVAAGSSSYQCAPWQPGWIAEPPNPVSLYSTTPSPSQANDVTTTFYDADGNELQQTNPDHDTNISRFDADSRTFCTADATIMTLEFIFDPGMTYPYICPAVGTAVPSTGSNPGYTWTVYDPAGRTTSQTNADGDTTSTTFDHDGNPLTVTDPSSNVTTDCYYDENGSGQCAHSAPSGGGAANMLYSKTSPPTQADSSGVVTTYTYEPGGATDVTTTPSGTATDGYDAMGDETAITYSTPASGYAASSNVTDTYNQDGTLASTENGSGTTDYTYDAAGDQTGQSFTAGSGSGLTSSTVSHSYYTNGDLETVGYPATVSSSTPTATYTYNANGEMASVSDWESNTTSFGYDDDANLTSTDLPGASVASTFDLADNENSTTVSSTSGGTQATIDDTPTPGKQISSESDSGLLTASNSYSYSAASQLTGVNSSSIGYTANGNVSTLPTGATPTYDSASELTSSVLSGTTTDYTYNTSGEQVETAVGGTATVYGGFQQNGSYSGQLSQDTSPITQVSAGYLHVLDLHADGTVWGFGANGAGQLGIGSTTDSSTPERISSLSNVTDVAAGGTWDSDGFSAAVTSTGSLYTWGYGGDGELGLGSTTSYDTPQHVTSISDVTQVAAGNDFMVALEGNGTVETWGNNYYGQLGIGSTTNEDTPQSVSGLSDVVAVEAGGSSAAAITASGNVYTWGYDGNGELGLGSTTQKDSPTEITSFPTGTKIKQLSMGQTDTMAVDTDGDVFDWGYNGSGELGLGSMTQEDSPQELLGVSALAASMGGSTAMVEETNGDVYTTGSNSNGQLGTGSLSPSSTDTLGEISGISYPGELAAGGYNFNLVLQANGTISGFGSNSNGQLGDGTTTSTDSPTSSDAETSDAYQAYAYDSTGLRLGINDYTTSSVTDNEVWDTTGQTPEILADGNESFIYGPKGEVVEQISQSGVAQFLVHDELGSTRMILNAEGNPVATYTFGPYGNVVSHTGTATTPIGFAGAYTDEATGLVYLENRYYEANTAQFLSVDPDVATTGQPYSYASDDPVNETDPSGLCSGWNPICDVTQAAKAVGHFVVTHKKEIEIGAGIALGVLAAATGVGAIIEGASVAGLLLGVASVAAGAGAASLDYEPCVDEHDSSACVGLGFGAVGAMAGAFGLAGAGLVEAGFIAEDSTAAAILQGIGVFGWNIGIAGTITDATTGIASAAEEQEQLSSFYNAVNQQEQLSSFYNAVNQQVQLADFYNSITQLASFYKAVIQGEQKAFLTALNEGC